MPGLASKWKECQHGWYSDCFRCRYPDIEDIDRATLIGISEYRRQAELAKYGRDAVKIASTFFTGSSRQFFLEDDKWIMEEHGRISRTPA